VEESFIRNKQKAMPLRNILQKVLLFCGKRAKIKGNECSVRLARGKEKQ
jgi:hypothetical protein